MGAVRTIAASPDERADAKALDQALTTLGACALLVRLRRPALERFLDEDMRLAILRGLAIDEADLTPPPRAPLAAAATPIFEAALQFLRVHESYAETLAGALGHAEERAQ
jgi:hypothetical protein